MIVSDNEEYLKRLKYLSTQAKDDVLYFVHDNIGYNYRMTNIQFRQILDQSVSILCQVRIEPFVRTNTSFKI